jgi:RNA polymerase sigma-70 factor (ECF subfamily)
MNSNKDRDDIIMSWVNEYGDYLFSQALKHIRNHFMAEDLVQETFLAATRGMKEFRGDSSPRTWLTSILRHKIIDHIRKHKNADKLSIDEPGIDVHFDRAEHWTKEGGPREWNLNPDQLFERGEFFQALNDCLTKLPDKFRSIFILREMDDLSREEISKELEISSNNVGVSLYRARALLRECLSKNWFSSAEARV